MSKGTGRVRRIVQLCVAALALGSAPSNALFGVPKKRFKGESLLDIGSLGLSKLDGIVAAVGDVDGSQILDLFVLSSDQRTISVWLWDSGQSASFVARSSWSQRVRRSFVHLCARSVTPYCRSRRHCHYKCRPGRLQLRWATGSAAHGTAGSRLSIGRGACHERLARTRQRDIQLAAPCCSFCFLCF
jgi:hypothetical protein